MRQRKVIEKAWLAIRRNAATSKSPDTRKEIELFEAELSTNLERICRQLQRKRFEFPAARGVPIPKDKKDRSKIRPLVVAKVESRIVQRAIHDVLVTVPQIRAFVYTKNSFGGVQKKASDLAAVPGAIEAVLEAIREGARYIIRSDIEQFFTRIRKSRVTEIVRDAVADPEFLQLFEDAIAVELENMASLREHLQAFPIEDLGVAQGNSLSPLLGNLVLYGFDTDLNAIPGVRCIRYIDDFIVLSHDKDRAEAAFARAQTILRSLEMNTAERKTEHAWIEKGFEFLGIELSNGLIRPSKKSRQKMLDSVEATFNASHAAFCSHRKSRELPGALSLRGTLQKAAGIIQGWGKHYWFCNDGACFEHLDSLIEQKLRRYLGQYSAELKQADGSGRWRLLGIEATAQIKREPFAWPTKRTGAGATQARDLTAAQ